MGTQNYDQNIFTTFSNGPNNRSSIGKHIARGQVIEELSGEVPTYEATGMLSEILLNSIQKNGQISSNYPRAWPQRVQLQPSEAIFGEDKQLNEDDYNHQIYGEINLENPKLYPHTNFNPRGYHLINDVPRQGLSLSLSSSIEGAKLEHLRVGNGEILFVDQGVVGGASFSPYGSNGNFGFSSGVDYNFLNNFMRNSKYLKAAQELLEEICCVLSKGQYNDNIIKRTNYKQQKIENNSTSGEDFGGSNWSSKEHIPPLSSTDKTQHQRMKVKLLSMLDEVDVRYTRYCERMQTMVNLFDSIVGYGAALSYTTLARKAMSSHFKCIKNAIVKQLRATCQALGEKDITCARGGVGLTKGETPRLKKLEQNFRQQKAVHHMGISEFDAWRPQRGLPDRSVNILRAWMFEHFLNPYPSDADKYLLSRQTGLSKNQVSNWFINARVRLWKPMVEEMYQKEAKEELATSSSNNDQNISTNAQTPIDAPQPITGSEINKEKDENDPTPNAVDPSSVGGYRDWVAEFGGMGQGANLATSLLRLGASGGDVSLTLGLRHGGTNVAEKGHLQLKNFGAC